MELSQLQKFKKVAELQSISKAAEELYVSQPSLSRTIKDLEDELNVTLFDRKNNRLFLSSAGKEILTHVENIFAEIDSIKMYNRTHGAVETVKLGAPSHSTASVIFRKLTDKSPDIIVKTMQVEDGNIEEALLQDFIDIGVSLTPPQNELLGSVRLKDCSICLSVHPNHRFANRESIHLRELAEENLVQPTDTNTWFQDWVNEVCTVNGVRLKYAATVPMLVFSEFMESTSYPWLTLNPHYPPRGRRKNIPIICEGNSKQLYILFRRDAEISLKNLLFTLE